MPMACSFGTSASRFVTLRRHRLDAVDAEEILPFTGFQGEAVAVTAGLELAIILFRL